jgi:hypothetical protein
MTIKVTQIQLLDGGIERMKFSNSKRIGKISSNRWIKKTKERREK